MLPKIILIGAERAREVWVTKIDTIEEEGNAAEKILQLATL